MCDPFSGVYDACSSGDSPRSTLRPVPRIILPSDSGNGEGMLCKLEFPCVFECEIDPTRSSINNSSTRVRLFGKFALLIFGVELLFRLIARVLG